PPAVPVALGGDPAGVGGASRDGGSGVPTAEGLRCRKDARGRFVAQTTVGGGTPAVPVARGGDSAGVGVAAGDHRWWTWLRGKRAGLTAHAAGVARLLSLVVGDTVGHVDEGLGQVDDGHRDWLWLLLRLRLRLRVRLRFWLRLWVWLVGEGMVEEGGHLSAGD